MFFGTDEHPHSVMHTETHGVKVKVRLDSGNPSDAARDDHIATHLPFRSWCEPCVVGKMPDLPHM